MRNWEKDGKDAGVNFIEKQGDSIVCEQNGFVFKVHRSNWPPKNLSPSQCLTPNDYFKYQVTKIHGNTYDLSVTNYNGADNNVDAICQVHGKFSIPAKYLKSLRGCPSCGMSRIGELTKSTTSEFINKAKVRHGETYDYSLVDYKSIKENVTIICNTHGVFEIGASNHLDGKGCQLCGRLKSSTARQLTESEVIRRFESIHHDRYDYSLVNYKGDAHDHVDIICSDHGVFAQSYANHYSGKGCPSCAKEYSPRLRSGFIKSYIDKNYASLYLLRCFNDEENFYKIGITTKPLVRRFGGKSAMPYSYETLHLFLADGESVWNLEKVLHRSYKSVKYIPNLSFGGMYECFSDIDVTDYVKLLTDLTHSESSIRALA